MLNPAREPRWGRSCGGRGGIRHRDGWGRGRGTGRGRSTSGVDRGREPQLPWWLDGGGDLVVSKPSHKEFGSSSSPTPPFFGGRVFGKNFRGCCFCFLVDFFCWMLIEKKKNCKKQSIFCQNIVSMFLRKRVLFVFFDLNVNFKMEDSPVGMIEMTIRMFLRSFSYSKKVEVHRTFYSAPNSKISVEHSGVAPGTGWEKRWLWDVAIKRLVWYGCMCVVVVVIVLLFQCAGFRCPYILIGHLTDWC